MTKTWLWSQHITVLAWVLFLFIYIHRGAKINKKLLLGNKIKHFPSSRGFTTHSQLDYRFHLFSLNYVLTSVKNICSHVICNGLKKKDSLSYFIY